MRAKRLLRRPGRELREPADSDEIDLGAATRQLGLIESGTSGSHGLWAFAALGLAVIVGLLTRRRSGRR